LAETSDFGRPWAKSTGIERAKVDNGAPLRNEQELTRFFALVSGQPYLVRRGLHEMAAHGTDLAVVEARAGSEEWIYSDHLYRILSLLGKDAGLVHAVKDVLEGHPCPDRESFYRLRSTGILVGESAHEARLRCRLYADYLQQHLL
jgi:hypothetical protein